MHRLPEEREHDENREIAGEVQREGSRDGRIHDELVRKRDLPDEPRVRGKAHRAALYRLLCGEPRPQRHRDERQEALSAEAASAKHHREHEPVDAEKGKRMQQRPRQAGDAAEIARGELALKKVAEERAIAYARHLRRRLRGREGRGRRNGGWHGRRGRGSGHGREHTSGARGSELRRHLPLLERQDDRLMVGRLRRAIDAHGGDPRLQSARSRK